MLAVDKAEDGASFLDVFEWFRTEGYDEEECFQNTRRIFRGGVIEGGAPFTKDSCTARASSSTTRSCGRPCRRTARAHPLLFVGKVAHEDIPVLAARVHDGVVRPPRYVPPMFRDLNGLAIWLGVSTFWGRLNSGAVIAHYERMFAGTSV